MLVEIVWIHSVENGLSRPAICNCIVDLIVKIRHLVLVDRRGIRVQYMVDLNGNTANTVHRLLEMMSITHRPIHAI